MRGERHLILTSKTPLSCSLHLCRRGLYSFSVMTSAQISFQKWEKKKKPCAILNIVLLLEKHHKIKLSSSPEHLCEHLNSCLVVIQAREVNSR